jgi:hypothetical protein
MKVDATPAYIPFRALTAQVAKEQNVSADTAAAHVASGHAIEPPPPIDDLDGNPRINLFTHLCNPRKVDELQPADRAKPTYDLAAYLSRRCVEAYLNEEEIKRLVEDDGGTDFEHFARFSDAAFGYRRGNTLVIAFRGTTGGWNALRQWPLTNLRAFPVRRPWRHLGFQMAWERLRPEMVEWVERTLPKGGDLILTGHSLGGAIAILAAFELAEDYHVRAVVTIGAPRVGLIEFRDRYLTKPSRPVIAGESAALLSEVTRRITHADDLVSRMPPGPIFRHVGEESRLNAQGTLVRGESRGVFERIYGGLDASVGWCYQQLDVQHMTPVYGAVPLYVRANIQGTEHIVRADAGTNRILHASAMKQPERPLGRLGKDMLKLQQRFPFLSLVTLTGLKWTLIGVGAIVASGVFLLGLFDFSSHRSKLYIGAFSQRYSMEGMGLKHTFARVKHLLE